MYDSLCAVTDDDVVWCFPYGLCVLLCSVVVFFCQAEDGIRDLVRSRGLGDVYKRQSFGYKGEAMHDRILDRGRPRSPPNLPNTPPIPTSVSYTHLTLPTSDLV